MRRSISLSVLATMIFSGCGGGSSSSAVSSPNVLPNVAAGAAQRVTASPAPSLPPGRLATISPSAIPSGSATLMPVAAATATPIPTPTPVPARPTFGPYTFQISVPQGRRAEYIWTIFNIRNGARPWHFGIHAANRKRTHNDYFDNTRSSAVRTKFAGYRGIFFSRGCRGRHRFSGVGIGNVRWGL